MADEVDVVVVGAGQAGLAVSYELTQAGVAHVVLEKGRVGETWRGWWDSCCLISPNWSVYLPGHPYDGEDPDGFWSRDELVAWLERYADAFAAPVRDGVEVTSLARGSGGGLRLETSVGQIAARKVVLATGAYQRQRRPAGAAALPADVLALGLDGYRTPAELPEGKVLVVGSGQSGCQIAEELCEAGRDVLLACGKAPCRAAARQPPARRTRAARPRARPRDRMRRGVARPARRRRAGRARRPAAQRHVDRAESLTPSERRVCRLAAEGLRNTQIAQALFVTLKTVETHLGNAYRKLDIASRAELAEALGAPRT